MHQTNPFFRILLFTLVIIMSFPLALFSNITFADDGIAYDDNANPYVAGQLIVGYKQNTPAEDRRSERAKQQLELKEELKEINAEVVKVKNERAKEVLSALKNNPKVAFAEFDYIVNVNHTPNDPVYASQVYLPYMKANSAWDLSKGSASVLIAVLDTGVNTGNTDLKGISLSGYNVLDNTTNYADDHGHGTMVMSVIASKMDNGFGIAGVAPESKFLAVKVMSSSGTGTYSSMIKGIEYATNQGAKVINMSIGGRTASSALKLAVDSAIAKGVTIVAAAGNEGSTSLSYPAAYDNVVGVGAVDINGVKMTFSNTGTGITLVAGGSARVATSTDYISSASGTSFAAPYVTGMVGLMYAVNPDMTPQKVMDAISQGASDLGMTGYDLTFGYGLADMEKIVKIASGNTPAPIVDKLPPIIQLLGETTMSLEVGNTYTEPGYTALDETDGDITSRVIISGNVDVATAGNYTLSYSVKDQAGNLSNIVTRNISVIASTSEEVIEDTKLVRDVEVVQGTLNKKTGIVSHTMTVLTPGTLDVVITYTGKTTPTATISGLNFNGKSGSFTVEPGSYVLTISSNTTASYSATITYPEREVPIDVPLGDYEVIVYGQDSSWLWTLYLVFTLMIFLAAMVMYKVGWLKFDRHKAPH